MLSAEIATSSKLSKSSEQKKKSRDSVNKTQSLTKKKSCKVSRRKIKKTGKQGKPLRRKNVLKKCIGISQPNDTATPDLSVLQRTRNALHDFQVRGVKTLHAAAKKHRVSYPILLRRYHGKVSMNRVGTGRLPFLTEEQEEKIAEWLLEMGRKGHPLKPTLILKHVSQYMEQTGEKRKFKEFRPTTGWLSKFLRRHPELKDAAEKYSVQKHATSNAAGRSLTEYCDMVSRLDLLNRPAQIYTVTKSTFQYKASHNSLVATPDQSRVQNKLTAVLCANASGTMIAPFLVFKGDRYSQDDNQMTGIPKDWGSDLSLNGCVNQTTFKTWLESHFIPQVLPERPLLLLLDNIDIHVDKSTFKFAKDNGIEFVCPVSNNNFSHLQQPLQCGFMDTLKQCWNQRLQEKMSTVNEQNVVGVFFKAWYDAYKPALIYEGFCTGGLYPTQLWSCSPANTFVRPATVEQHDASTVETSGKVGPRKQNRKRKGSNDVDDVIQGNEGEVNDERVSTAKTSGKRHPKKQNRKRKGSCKVDGDIQGNEGEMNDKRVSTAKTSGKEDPKKQNRKRKGSSTVDDEHQGNEGELNNDRVSIAETSAKRDPKKQKRKGRGTGMGDQRVQCVLEEVDEDGERCKFCHEGEQDGDGTWVCCDSCDHWMHLDCLPEGFAIPDNLEGEAIFYCTTCKDVHN